LYQFNPPVKPEVSSSAQNFLELRSGARRAANISGRGQKVMLDADLAKLYRVPTKSLNLAVKRNADRFPEDFTFQLTDDEVAGLSFHFETSKRGRALRDRTFQFAIRRLNFCRDHS